MPDTSANKNFSFFSLFAPDNFQLVVPMVQREYAQGREEIKIKEIRDAFLSAIFDYLDTDTPGHDLDFIYGHQEQNGEFIPLDGQQRLTTLFLLHRYLAIISNDKALKESFDKRLIKDRQARFGYRTRQSATDFCNALMTKPLVLAPADIPSSIIKDQNWYHLQWDFDPTIQGMLVMLDSIHEKYFARDEQKRKEYLRKLVDGWITFNFLNMDNFGLTDDLYIKMNSRGKPLTDFENFKSKFGDYLETALPETRYQKLFSGMQKEVSASEYFSHSADGNWLDMIWELSSRLGENGLKKIVKGKFDSSFSSLIKNLLMFAPVSCPGKKGDATAIITALYDHEPFSFQGYLEKGILSSHACAFLIQALDAIERRLKTSAFCLYQPYNEDGVLKNVLGNKFTSRGEALAFYGWLRFLMRYPDASSPALAEWMRVIGNLTRMENTDTDTTDLLINRLLAIEELVPNANSILLYLADPKKEVSSFSSWQVLEEKVKACLLLRSQPWRNAIETYELHGYFLGQISFILEFSGIFDYYSQYKNCGWPDGEDADKLAAATRYGDRASVIFAKSYAERINDGEYCFERAVMTKGDYLLANTNENKWNLLSTSEVGHNIYRDYSWRRLLRYIPKEEDKEAWKKRRFVKEVLADERFDVNEPVSSLLNIANDGSSSHWLDAFIETPALFAYARAGFICYDSTDRLVILSKRNMGSWRVEVYTYSLWKSELENADYSPLKSEYVEMWGHTGLEEYPHISYRYDGSYGEYILTIVAEYQEGDDLKGYVIYLCNAGGGGNPKVERFLSEQGFGPLDKGGRREAKAADGSKVKEILAGLAKVLVGVGQEKFYRVCI